MIDHIGINVSDYKAGKKFYSAALLPLGYKVLAEFGSSAGLGAHGDADFWISEGKPAHPHVHVAFQCDKHTMVDKFYAAALKAGAKDNGPPGIRKDYAADYYAAYIIDPDGNNIEAVCHSAE